MKSNSIITSSTTTDIIPCNGTPAVSTDDANRPLPNDFVNYYPYACGQFQLGYEVHVTKIVQSDYVGTVVSKAKKYPKNTLTHKNEMIAHISRLRIASEDKFVKDSIMESFADNPIYKVIAIYNLGDRLTHLKFEKSQQKTTQKMIAILGLFIRFYPYLISITIRNKVDAGTIYELSKVVSTSNIVELYLDGCYVREANYHVLLSESCDLKILSLARCTLTDPVLRTITEKLDHQNPSSKALVSLNLSSNRITDVGAVYIAEALRTNRRLVHLNLSGNCISDDGIFSILATMLEFPIQENELIAARGRRLEYIKARIEMVNELVLEITEEEYNKIKRKSTKSSTKSKVSTVPIDTHFNFSPQVICRIHERAEIQADANIGKFIDPFYPNFTKDYIAYSYGNNTLLSLNLAYNNMSALSIRKILEVLRYQKFMNRKPRGLINLNLEGNPLPMLCPDLAEINDLLLQAPKTRSMSVNVKRRP